jgi:hypothetical protein
MKIYYLSSNIRVSTPLGEDLRRGAVVIRRQMTRDTDATNKCTISEPFVIGANRRY